MARSSRKYGIILLRAFFPHYPQIGQFEDNQGPALNQVFLFAIFRALSTIATVPDIPNPLANVLRSQAISPGFEIFSPGILNIDPGQQRGREGAQDNAVFVFPGQSAQQNPHFGHNVEAPETQLPSRTWRTPKPFANQAYFLAVGQDNDVAAGLARPGRIDGPLYQRYPGQLLDQLVRNDGIFSLMAGMTMQRFSLSVQKLLHHIPCRSNHIVKFRFREPMLEGEGDHAVEKKASAFGQFALPKPQLL